jgi:hypothetical protein
MRHNQKGFGAVEGLLILILLSILGFTGYYVYHSQQNTNKTYDTAAKASGTPSSNSKSSSNEFVFKELGVQFESTSELKGLAYSVQHFSDGDSAYLTLPAFKAANDSCYGKTASDTDGPSFAAIGKSTGTFDQSQQVEAGLLKQFTGFYITISYPNGITLGCKNDLPNDTVQAAAHKYQQAFLNAFQATATEVQ